ncbi:Uncharacterised protein [Aerococcus viridans]|uniref:Uncharacterized protein n=1 Tax=Aerococcus viridans TaxID=1377 RepID=A0AAU8U7H0_9LACT|nr:hypothetical protein [Aerococcus viridans]AMC00533.1 hypothetical protein AWM76_02545 [Aerococcus viridans]SUU07865.1 Uncharacterised protein [Aerococcus viridans]
MSGYVKSKKDMKFQSQDALNYVQSVIDDADLALHDKSRRMENSPIGEAVAGAVGVGVGAGVGFAGLYLGGSVVGLSAAGITSGLAAAGGLIGGGMVAGIAVLAAPAVVLGGAGLSIASHVKNKKLREVKELIYKNAVAKQTAIVEALSKEANADKERIDYLSGLNVLLQSAIKDLQHDLGMA